MIDLIAFGPLYRSLRIVCLLASKDELRRGALRYTREALPWDELIVLRDKRSANELIYSICSFVL